ncbi:MAG: hypothetical protein UT66_C0001G0010 [candidate division CPR2 bacterium GW2011_GWC1_39_9]|uniref:Uncharacterized protein n=1 Tax=candidate division CPR2 bacterium GW2011_GWC2_39_10 TaxID=1618345 RepID=A0A0G0M550_UNCC2|nr:MAG: hypothetical protein UT18_C0001G0012 [candidate division CPR2 bacterium GW2011_GWC2_39_10]KKR36186.1 MAG: hypothetical protein UT66_C0001G0010 [candidate division CPR2 bacterium GW2011_GWC1_39_9]
MQGHNNIVIELIFKFLRLASYLTYIFLIPVFLLLIIIFNFRVIFFTPSAIESIIEKNQVYKTLYDNYGYFSGQIIKLAPDGMELSQTELTMAFKKAFPENDLKAKTHSQIEGYYGFFSGRQDYLPTIDIQKNLDVFRNEFINTQTKMSNEEATMFMNALTENIPSQVSLPDQTYQKLKNYQPSLKIMWPIALAGPILSLLVVFLLAYLRNIKKEKKYFFRSCGWFLFTVNLLFLAAVFLSLTITAIIKVIVLPDMKILPDFLKEGIFLPIAESISRTLFYVSLTEFICVLILSFIFIYYGHSKKLEKKTA